MYLLLVGWWKCIFEFQLAEKEEEARRMDERGQRPTYGITDGEPSQIVEEVEREDEEYPQQSETARATSGDNRRQHRIADSAQRIGEYIHQAAQKVGADSYENALHTELYSIA